jgi:hypothetical protein
MSEFTNVKIISVRVKVLYKTDLILILNVLKASRVSSNYGGVR